MHEKKDDRMIGIKKITYIFDSLNFFVNFVKVKPILTF